MKERTYKVMTNPVGLGFSDELSITEKGIINTLGASIAQLDDGSEVICITIFNDSNSSAQAIAMTVDEAFDFYQHLWILVGILNEYKGAK